MNSAWIFEQNALQMHLMGEHRAGYALKLEADAGDTAKL